MDPKRVFSTVRPSACLSHMVFYHEKKNKNLLTQGITCYHPRSEKFTNRAYAVGFSDGERQFSKNFGALRVAGGTKNVFVDVYTHDGMF